MSRRRRRERGGRPPAPPAGGSGRRGPVNKRRDGALVGRVRPQMQRGDVLAGAHGGVEGFCAAARRFLAGAPRRRGGGGGALDRAAVRAPLRSRGGPISRSAHTAIGACLTRAQPPRDRRRASVVPSLGCARASRGRRAATRCAEPPARHGPARSRVSGLRGGGDGCASRAAAAARCREAGAGGVFAADAPAAHSDSAGEPCSTCTGPADSDRAASRQGNELSLGSGSGWN